MRLFVGDFLKHCVVLEEKLSFSPTVNYSFSGTQSGAFSCALQSATRRSHHFDLHGRARRLAVDPDVEERWSVSI